MDSSPGSRLLWSSAGDPARDGGEGAPDSGGYQLAKLPVPVPRYRSIASFSRGSPTRRVRHLSPIALLAVALAAAVISPGGAHAASRTWTGLGLTNNWSEAANWLPAIVPGAGDTAVFDGTGVKNATVDIPSVQGVAINAGYTGIISQALGNPLTVGTADFLQTAGTFVGGNSPITVNDAFAVSGGSFTSTSATLTVSGAFTLSGGTFAHNGGTVAYSGGAATINLGGAATFNHVSFLGTGTKTISAGNTLSVMGTLSLTDGQVNTGTLAAQGNILVASTFDGGSGTLLINGSGAQAWSDVFGAAASLPVVNINKPSGTLTMSGSFRTTRSWTWTAGTLNAAGSTVIFAGTLTVSGSHTLDAVEIRGTVTVAAGTTLTAAGTLTLTSGSLSTGTLAAQADVTATLGYTGGGTATLLLNGSGAQTLSGLHSSVAGSLPNLSIAKPAGTLTISGTLRTARNWTYLSGGLTTTGSTLIFNGTQTISGSHTLDAVEIRGGTVTIAAGTTLTAAGSLTLFSGALNGPGTLAAQADIAAASGFTGGSATLLIAGAGAQALTGAATPTTGGLPTVLINKPSGTLILAGTLRTSRDWTLAAGAVDPGTSLVVLVGTQTVTGSVVPFHDLTVNGGGVSLTTSGQITVDGTLALVQGVLNAGTGNVSIGPIGSVLRTAGHVAGALRKPVPIGIGLAVTFEIGDVAVYTPVTVTFGAVTVPGSMVASSVPGDHPAVATSIVDPAASVNRHWVLLNEATAFDTLDLNLTFVAADLDPGARTDRLVIGKRDATWTAPAVGAALPTSITALGITSLSEFAVGEPAPSPAVATSFPLPQPTPVPTTSRLPNTIGAPGGGGGSPALPWLLLGTMTVVWGVNVASRRSRQRRRSAKAAPRTIWG